MTKLSRAVGLALGLCAVALSANAAPASGRYLVVFKTDVLPADAATRIAHNGGRLVRTFDAVGVVAVTGNSTFAERMARDTKVLAVGAEHVFARPDHAMTSVDEDAAAEAAPTPADNLYNAYQWDMRRIG